jgi:hypothetical protein
MSRVTMWSYSGHRGHCTFNLRCPAIPLTRYHGTMSRMLTATQRKGHAREGRHGLFQGLQPFGAELQAKNGWARDIAVWPGEAHYQRRAELAVRAVRFEDTTAVMLAGATSGPAYTFQFESFPRRSVNVRQQENSRRPLAPRDLAAPPWHIRVMLRTLAESGH